MRGRPDSPSAAPPQRSWSRMEVSEAAASAPAPERRVPAADGAKGDREGLTCGARAEGGATGGAGLRRRSGKGEGPSLVASVTRGGVRTSHGSAPRCFIRLGNEGGE